MHTEYTGEVVLWLPCTSAQHVTQSTLYQQHGHPRHLHVWYEEGRSANEISTTLKLLVCATTRRLSLDLKQAFDRVSPLLLSKAMESFSRFILCWRQPF